MTRKPANFQWLGYTAAQVALLDRLDFYGNSGWTRTSQLEVMMPALLDQCEGAGLTASTIKHAMSAVGYDDDSLHQLDRWESKRTTGRFGR